MPEDPMMMLASAFSSVVVSFIKLEPIDDETYDVDTEGRSVYERKPPKNDDEMDTTEG